MIQEVENDPQDKLSQSALSAVAKAIDTLNRIGSKSARDGPVPESAGELLSRAKAALDAIQDGER
jgi:hypothetical protein